MGSKQMSPINLTRKPIYRTSKYPPKFLSKCLKNSYFAEQNKSLVADENVHELLRFTISTNFKSDVEQPY